MAFFTSKARAEGLSAWVGFFVGIALLFFYYPLSILFNWMSIDATLNMDEAWKRVAYWPVFWIVIQVFLISVYALLVVPVVEKAPPLFKITLAIFLWSPPLVSFAYYLGGIRNGPEFYDVTWHTITSSALGAILFEKTRNQFASSFFLACAYFVPLFLINDILGEINVVWHTTALSPAFYVSKTLFPIFSVAIISLSLKSSEKQTLSERLKAFSLLMMAVWFLTLILQMGVPVILAKLKGTGLSFSFELSWMSPLLALFLIPRQNKLSYRCLLIICGSEFLWLLVLLVRGFKSSGLSVWDHLQLTNGIIISLAFIGLGGLLLKREVRGAYGIAY